MKFYHFSTVFYFSLKHKVHNNNKKTIGYFPVALSVWQDPGDPHARLEALLEAAELAALPRRQVDLARLALRAEEYLVVPENDNSVVTFQEMHQEKGEEIAELWEIVLVVSLPSDEGNLTCSERRAGRTLCNWDRPDRRSSCACRPSRGTQGTCCCWPTRRSPAARSDPGTSNIKF